MEMDHTIIHFEIPADDVQKLKTFYENVLGWKIIKAPMPGQEYWLVYTVPTDDKGMPQRPGVNGGIYARAPNQSDMTQVNYISVENIDEYAARVAKEGGKILMPKQQVPTVGWFVIAADPEGNRFGLLQPEMPPTQP